jgi:alkylation response protein AidB-like acyl-CoA dehydrogenase
MRFAFTPEQDRFRRDVVRFLETETPAEFSDGGEEGVDDENYFAVARAFEKRLAEQGWLVIGWPKEYGGGGASLIEQGILNEALGYFGVPNANSTGLRLAGPAIMRYGTEAQKQRYLPQIARGDVVWCQGFTEPNSGSDLPSLVTSAVREGAYYRVNGQKVFTSRAPWAEYIYLLCRTDLSAGTKRDGISILLVDMQSPGLTVKPLFNIGGTYRQAEVFFDDVLVPVDNLIGEENKGWQLATATLSFERSGVQEPARAKRAFEDFLQLCGTLHRGRSSPLDSELVRQRLAQCGAELEAWRLLCWRVIWLQTIGHIPRYEVSMQNVLGKDWRQRFAQIVMQILGPYGLLEEGSPLAPGCGRFQRQYMRSINKHLQGTSEMQRNTIAVYGLGLPRA